MYTYFVKKYDWVELGRSLAKKCKVSFLLSI